MFPCMERSPKLVNRPTAPGIFKGLAEIGLMISQAVVESIEF
ncbi:MAG: hypothetical protein AAF609_27415 [Cyanobacteria bacterium P01_C01_bin.120]